MKIVHIVESLDVGGLEHTVLALAQAQQARGHSVAIICLWRRGALAAQAVAAGLEVQCCDKQPGFDWRAFKALRGMLRQAAPDVAHTHNAMAHYYSALAGLGLGLPRLVSTRHGMGSRQLGARRERLYRLALHRTDAAVSVCAAARARYVRHGVMPRAKAVVVPNGIELSRFVPRSDQRAAQLRSELGLPAQAVLFGSVGRLHEAKRQSLLLQALRRLLDAGVSAAVVLVGDGDQRAALESEIEALSLQRHARLLGTRRDVHELLAGLDVFVLPSRTEGYSLALVEACASALPIIATQVGGNAEIVAHDLSGLLVPRDDLDALTQAMARLAGNPPLRLMLGQAARTWALREGSLDTMAERYLALYQRGHTPAMQGAV